MLDEITRNEDGTWNRKRARKKNGTYWSFDIFQIHLILLAGFKVLVILCVEPIGLLVLRLGGLDVHQCEEIECRETREVHRGRCLFFLASHVVYTPYR